MSQNHEVAPAERLLEAMLFASPEPLTRDQLAQQLGDDGDQVDGVINTLKATYEGRGIHLVEIDGVFSFRTAPELAPQLKVLRQPRRKLPRAAAEVLAIIAYHQPVTRAEIESIRGVETSRGTLDILLELGWVRPGQRRETPGRPLLWHTTPDFLSHFNLNRLEDLPGVEELKAAGLLDARPVLSNLPREGVLTDVSSPMDIEEDDFASWVEVSTEAVVEG